MEILHQFWKLGFWFPSFKRFLSQFHKRQFFLDLGWDSPLLKRLRFLAFLIWYETLHCRMRLEFLKSSNFVQNFPLAKEIRFLHCLFWGRLEFLQYFNQSENLQELLRVLIVLRDIKVLFKHFLCGLFKKFSGSWFSWWYQLLIQEVSSFLI